MPEYHVMMKDGTAKRIRANSLGEARAIAAKINRTRTIRTEPQMEKGVSEQQRSFTNMMIRHTHQPNTNHYAVGSGMYGKVITHTHKANDHTGFVSKAPGHRHG